MEDKHIIKNLMDRVSKLEDSKNEIEKDALTNKYELSSLITKAVYEGNRENMLALEKLDVKVDRRFLEVEERTSDLENAEAKEVMEKRKYISKIILSTVVGFVVLGIVSNATSIISEAILVSNETKNRNEVIINENE